MENFAIVVGIDDYHERPLQGAVGDAKRFVSWLKDSGQIPNPPGSNGEYNQKKIKLITSEQFNGLEDPPTDVEINRAVYQVYQEVIKLPKQQADRLYFYFAGHGLGITLANTALCMRPWTQFLNLYCISSSKFCDGFVQLNLAKEVFIILDCCRDIDVLVTDPTGPRWNQPSLNGVTGKYVIISSTKLGERSQEIEVKDTITDISKKRGAFTKFLIDALNGDAADANGKIYLQDLYRHLRNNFKSYTAALRYIQEAAFIDSFGENILVHQVSRPANQTANFILTFNRTSTNIELQDGSFNTIQQGPVSPNDQWSLNLNKGIYVLIDHDLPANDAGKEKQIKNYNTNSLSYDKF